MRTSEGIADRGLRDVLDVLDQHGGVQKIWCEECTNWEPVEVGSIVGLRVLICGKCHLVIARIKED